MMRWVLGGVVLILAVAALGAVQPLGNYVGDIQDTGFSQGGDIDLTAGNLCISAPITDIAPTDLVINSAACYSQGTQSASDIILAGGIDEKTITIDAWGNCGTDTVTLTINGSATVLTEATEWTAATSDAATATSLATAVSAVSGVSAVAVAAVVYVQPDNCATYSLSMAEGDATCTTLAAGSDGQALFTDGSGTAPSIAWATDPNTGFYRSGSDTIWFATGGSGRVKLASAAVTFFEPIVVPAAESISFSAQTEIRSPADGQTQFCNAAQTQCFTIDASAADTMKVWDGAGTGAGTLSMGTGTIDFTNGLYTLVGTASVLKVKAPTGLRAIQSTDNTAASDAMLGIIPNDATIESNASSGTQYGISLTPEIEQSGTAAFTGIYADVTDTASGSAQDYLLDLNWGGSPMFQVEDDGDTIIAGTHTYHGAMAIHENTDAQTIATAAAFDLVYTASDWATGDVLNGTTFQDGATDTVSGAYADAGGSPNSVTVTAASHPFSDGEIVGISGTTNYNGIFEVQNATANTFTIVSAFNAEGAVGTVTRGGNLTITNAGTYQMHYSVSMAPATGQDQFDFCLFAGTTAGVPNHLGETETRTESKNAGKFSSVASGGIHAFSAGDVLSIAVKNVDGARNTTIRYVNVWIVQI